MLKLFYWLKINMSESTPKTPPESAFSRLREFPSDPAVAAHEAGKEVRMNEMEAWANGVGAHTEHLAAAHHRVVRHALEHAAKTGAHDRNSIEDRLEKVPKDWRTGVRVEPNGNIAVHDHYPYYGDTPAGGEWTKYRSPKNIGKNSPDS